MLDGLQTSQTRLVATTPALVSADLAGPGDLGFALGAAVPRDWPPRLWARHRLVWLRERLAEHPDEVGWWPAYLVSYDDVVVGVAGFQGPPSDGELELLVALVPSEQDLGYGKDAVEAVLAAVRGRDGIRRIVALVDAGEVGASRALERAGFVPAGPGGPRGMVRYERPRG